MSTKQVVVTLTQNRDFLRLYKRGNSLVHPLLVTYALPNKTAQNRIGITASKKIGGAVQRNRARRIIREAYRQLSLQPDCIVQGYDIVFVARARTVQVRTTDIYQAMKKHFSQLASAPQKPGGRTAARSPAQA